MSSQKQFFMNNTIILILVCFALAFTSCSTSNHARIDGRQADVLAVQSSFEMKKTNPVVESASLDKISPEAISADKEMRVKGEMKQVPQLNSFETSTRKSVKAEMQQFTREQKKELRKVILYAYLGKEIPVSNSSQKDGAPFIDQTGAAIIAFFIPALGAGLYFGKDKRTWISLGLMLLFWLPGAIYAIIMILRD